MDRTVDKKMIKKHFLTLFSSFSLLAGCTNNAPEPEFSSSGFQFFPLQDKLELTYEVEEIYYRNTGEIDTLRYLLIDRVTDSTNINARIKLTGYRFKQMPNGSEQTLSTISLIRSNNTLTQQLGNTEEVKLSFPVREGLQWNGNPKATEPDIFTAYKAFQPYQFEDSLYQQTVQIIQEDNKDSIQVFDKRVEVYVADIGLVYKLSSYLDFCNQTECLGLKEIDSGRTITMKRIF